VERTKTRLKTLAFLVALMFAALSSRLWFLQVLASPAAQKQIQLNSTRTIEVPGPRGVIVDDKGHVIVGNRMSLEVLVNQQQLGSNATAELHQLSKLLHMPEKKIRSELSSVRYYPYQPIPVAKDVPLSTVQYLSERSAEFPGVSVLQGAVRKVTPGAVDPNILGFVGPITKQQYGSSGFKGYSANATVGQSGLELQYDRALQGVPGVDTYLVNAAGENIKLERSTQPSQGDTLKLNLDSRIQQIGQNALLQGIMRARSYYDSTEGGRLTASAGAFVVMDPNTGAIKGIGSYTGPHDAPAFDRAFLAAYAPGSTFKPFIALSALHWGIVSPGQYIPCPGSYSYPGDPTHQQFFNWNPVNSGSITLAEALKISCDTVFYQLGAQFWNQYRQNPAGGPKADALQRDLNAFGFGEPSGIDLPYSATGFIPDPTVARVPGARYGNLPKKVYPYGWEPGNSILTAIGQDAVTVSPLQLANAYSAIANGGNLCKPRLASEILSPSGKIVRKIKPDCRKTLPFTTAQIDYVKQALSTVVQPGGTAYYAFLGYPDSQYPIAGKTGTAQRPPFQDTSWFAAMVPWQHPQYVVVAMVEQGGHGSTTAAPIVRQIIQGIYHINGQYHSGGANN
jgi:penicillin-binding protein 2